MSLRIGNLAASTSAGASAADDEVTVEVRDATGRLLNRARGLAPGGNGGISLRAPTAAGVYTVTVLREGQAPVTLRGVRLR